MVKHTQFRIVPARYSLFLSRQQQPLNKKKPNEIIFLCFVFHPKLESVFAFNEMRTIMLLECRSFHCILANTRNNEKMHQRNIEYLIKWQGQFFYDIKINETFITRSGLHLVHTVFIFLVLWCVYEFLFIDFYSCREFAENRQNFVT